MLFPCDYNCFAMNQTTTILRQKESTSGNDMENDDKNDNSKSGFDAGLSMNEKTEVANTKKKPARVSIGKYEAASVGMMAEEGNQLGSSLASDSDGDSEDVVHVRKKQKTGIERQEEEGRATKNDQEENNDATEGDENDDLTHVGEEATAVVVPMFVEDDEENPNEESFRKLKKWTNELLGIKKKLEDARVCKLYCSEYEAMRNLCFYVSDCVHLLLLICFCFRRTIHSSLSKLQNAVLLNKLYTVGAKRENHA